MRGNIVATAMLLVLPINVPTELVDAGFARSKKVADYANCMSVVDSAETWVEATVVYFDDITKNGHERQEILKEAGAGDRCWRAQNTLG